MEMCTCGHRASEHQIVGAFFFVPVYSHCLTCARSPEWRFGAITIRRRRCEAFRAATRSLGGGP